jgi:hypothetical protein
MFAVFAVMRELHELLWYLASAVELSPAAPLKRDLRAAFSYTEGLTNQDPASLLRLDLREHRARVGALLLGVGDLVRASVLEAFGNAPSGQWSVAGLMRRTGLPRQSLDLLLKRLTMAGWLAEEAGHYTLTQRGAAVELDAVTADTDL